MADLFDFAAERAALSSGRPVSQERLAVRGVDAPAAGPLFATAAPAAAPTPDEAPAGWSCLCGSPLARPSSPCPARCGR